MTNAINVIFPYKHEGMWVFDDERIELDKEPFIEGAEVMIDKALSLKGIKNLESGFRLIFSESEFPRFDLKIDWIRKDVSGNWYKSEDFQMEGWLCPALLKYFDEAPKHIYTRFEEKDN